MRLKVTNGVVEKCKLNPSVTMTHEPSNITVECDHSQSEAANEKIAMTQMTKLIEYWVRLYRPEGYSVTEKDGKYTVNHA